MPFKKDERGQIQPKSRAEAQKTGRPSPARPHDKPEHRDSEKTPGAGALPGDEADVNPGTG